MAKVFLNVQHYSTLTVFIIGVFLTLGDETDSYLSDS